MTTVGYGPALSSTQGHIEVPTGRSSLPRTGSGVARLGLRRFRGTELTSPGERAVLADVDSAGEWDLVVANDARALPLAFRAARGAPVWADMHEWAREENSNSVIWRILVAPYMDELCRKYLPRAAAVTTVNGAIATLYEERYGLAPVSTVRNAIPTQPLGPTALEPERVRLVHSGVAAPERHIEWLIDAVARLDERFSLDLYLTGDPKGYLGRVSARAAAVSRVTLHPPVTPPELPATLNAYDLGVFLLPPKSTNNRLMLPNKFFDFVQARLGVVMSPAPETDALIQRYGLGPTLADASVGSLVETLSSVTAEQIEGWKHASHEAAADLGSSADVATMHAIVDQLTSGGGRDG